MSLNRYIAISIDPSTEAGALEAAKSLRQGGWRTELFLTAGTETARFEGTIFSEPAIQAVLDYSLCLLSAVRLEVAKPSIPERLTSAALLGIPQVIVPGALDHIILHGQKEYTIHRNSHQVDETTTVYRTSPEDNDALGKELAFKASASKGPVVIVFPRGGLSQWDREGEPLHDVEANRALLDSLHLWKAPNIELIESHRHINDPLFGQIVADQMLKLLVYRR